MQEEIFPLVDEDGNIIGQATRSECHGGSRILHPVIHLHVFNSNGKLFLQKRSPNKDVQPNLWDSSVGGHIDLNETPRQAAIREASEEIGLINFDPVFIAKHIIEDSKERELTYCFYTIYDGKFKLNMDELADGKFWTINEIKENIGKGVFTFNFELDFELFLKNGVHSLQKK